MVGQERFDELAKGLATNQLSRGQVLKSFVAGALLATPLGALWNRAASAQEAGCVAPECTESAQQAYASCKRRCKRLNNPEKRKKCLKKCRASFAEQNLSCGCVTVDIE